MTTAGSSAPWLHKTAKRSRTEKFGVSDSETCPKTGLVPSALHPTPFFCQIRAGIFAVRGLCRIIRLHRLRTVL